MQCYWPLYITWSTCNPDWPDLTQKLLNGVGWVVSMYLFSYRVLVIKNKPVLSSGLVQINITFNGLGSTKPLSSYTFEICKMWNQKSKSFQRQGKLTILTKTLNKIELEIRLQLPNVISKQEQYGTKSMAM